MIEYLFGAPFAPRCDHWHPTRHGFHEHHGKRLSEEGRQDKRTCAPEIGPRVRDEAGHQHVLFDSVLPSTFYEVGTLWALTKNDQLQDMVSSNGREGPEQIGKPLHSHKAPAADDETRWGPYGRLHVLLRPLPDRADRKRVIEPDHAGCVNPEEPRGIKSNAVGHGDYRVRILIQSARQ